MSLRLVKVIVQPCYVWDDGDELHEVQSQPTEIAAKDWPDYPTKLADDAKAQEAQLAAQLNGHAPAAAD